MARQKSPVDLLRIVGIPETNKVMAGELSRLAGRSFDGVRLPQPEKEGTGTLVYPFDAALAALALKYHRTSSRILRGICRSRAPRLASLFDDFLGALLAREEPVHEWGRTFSVAAVNVGAFAAGERQVVGVAKNALLESASRRGGRMSVDAKRPDLCFRVSMHDDEVTLSVDLAGGPMHRRGYRTEAGQAPLRENLAAVLVMLSRHDARKEVLVDPMAGSGTIAVEGAAMARGMPGFVGHRRPRPGRMGDVTSELAKLKGPLFGDTAPRVLAVEKDRESYSHMERNLARAHLDETVETFAGDFRALSREKVENLAGGTGKRGVILSNPPYGERIGGNDAVRLYRDLGRWCRQFNGWRAGFLVANPDFESAFAMKPRVRKPLRNGPLKGYFYLFDLPP